VEEIWKDIKGFEGIYQVSNQGRVKRLETTTIMRNQVTSWEQPLAEYIFKPPLDGHGYPQVSLSMGETKRTARVHRLVAEAFLSDPSEELVQTCMDAGLNYVLVNHKDTDPTNNVWTNLEWCSPKFNCDWSVTSGTHNTETMKGSLNYNSELTEEDVDAIVNLLKTKAMSQEKIGELYGVKQITISNIWTGRSWAWYAGIPWKARSRRKKQRSISIAES
jgi:predicted XRE-type DNA-binding protein